MKEHFKHCGEGSGIEFGTDIGERGNYDLNVEKHRSLTVCFRWFGHDAKRICWSLQPQAISWPYPLQGRGQQCMSSSQIKLEDPEVIDFSSRLDTEPHAAALGGSEKVVFGLFENDGIVVPQPPIQRALRIVQKALRSQGIQGPCYHMLRLISANASISS